MHSVFYSSSRSQTQAPQSHHTSQEEGQQLPAWAHGTHFLLPQWPRHPSATPPPASHCPHGALLPHRPSWSSASSPILAQQSPVSEENSISTAEMLQMFQEGAGGGERGKPRGASGGRAGEGRKGRADRHSRGRPGPPAQGKLAPFNTEGGGGGCGSDRRCRAQTPERPGPAWAPRLMAGFPQEQARTSPPTPWAGVHSSG